MLIKKKIGICSYGVAIPSTIITTKEIEQAQGKEGLGIGRSLGVVSKTVPEKDQDTITLATEAALSALHTFTADALSINALFIGSESHPYAVKPSGTVVKNALGLSDDMALADLQFACKAGTQGMQIGYTYLLSDYSPYVLVIGADTAQAKPGDALEFTAGAGAAAYILGKSETIVDITAMLSIATDTPDFWRRAGQSYPEHAGRFSGEPAYFYHISTAAQKIMNETGLQAKDFAYCVFHTPNGKFPRAVAQKLGFNEKQLLPSLVVEQIGNTYAAAVPLALSAVLDKAKPHQKILVVSYGSGSGSDAFVMETTELITQFNKNRTNTLAQQLKKVTSVTYQTYRSTMDLLTH
jgi:hydroxymethylglutaryl-CoA synthase